MLEYRYARLRGMAVVAMPLANSYVPVRFLYSPSFSAYSIPSSLATPAPDVVTVILDGVVGVVSLDHLG